MIPTVTCNFPESCSLHPKHESHDHKNHKHEHHEHKHHKEHTHVEILVVNEDSGHEFKIEALLDKTVQAAIDEAYAKMRLTRKPDDRLRCECNGNDVFSHANMMLAEYIKKEVCPDRTWLFASGTGGALIGKPSPVDPEVASATLWKHLDDFWKTGRPSRLGWELIKLDQLTAIVALPGKRADGTVDKYYLRLDGKYYDASPAVVTFVNPEEANTTDGVETKTWSPATEGTVLVADSDDRGVDKTNLNRCPIFCEKSLGKPKAAESARVLFDAEFKLDPHSKRLQDLELISKNLYVVSAVDKNISREAIQKALYPARLFSASTSDLRAEVMRCGPPGLGPCLRCYNPVPSSTPDENLRKQLKQSSGEQLQKICSQIGVDETDASHWLESGACGQTDDRILEFLRRSEEEPVQFLVGFVSVLAGTLLAAEVLKDHFAIEAPLSDSVQRAVFQFMNPESERNRASPYRRDPNCPLCAPDSVAVRVWNERFRALDHQRT